MAAPAVVRGAFLSAGEAAALTDVASAERALAAARAREAEVDAELEAAVRARPAVARELGALAEQSGMLELVRADLGHLATAVGAQADKADAISAKVRELDTAQGNVLRAVGRLQAMMDRTSCLEGVSQAMAAEDYERAAAFVADFTALQEELGGGGSGLGGESSGGEAQLSEQEARMGEAREKLTGVVRARLAAARERRDAAAALRFARLFPQLGLTEEGLQAYLSFLRGSVAAVAREEFDGLSTALARADSGAAPFVETLTNLLRAVAVAVEENTPVVREHFGGLAPRELVRELQKECDIRGTLVLQRFVEHRRLAALARRARRGGGEGDSAGGDAVDPREVESFLEEMLLLGQRVEEFSGFMVAQLRAAHADEVLPPATLASFRGGDLSQKEQEILMYYVQLEEYFMSTNMRKAIDIDETPPEALTSSMVDDVFFILQKCTHRAVSSRNVQCACAGMNHVGALLGNEYREAISAKLDAAMLRAEQAARVAQRGSGDEGGAAAKTGEALPQAVAVALNNADVSADYIQRLFGVLDEACASYYPSTADRERMRTVLADMTAAEQALRALSASALERAREVALAHAPIKASLAAAAACDYVLSEERYATNERSDPWALPLAAALEAALTPMADSLTQTNYDGVLLSLAERVAALLEGYILGKRFNQLGGLQLDREIRTVVQALSALAGGAPLRERFARVSQIATVLNLERVAEIIDYWGDNAGAITWRLSPQEIKRVLALRKDFSEHSIQALQL